MTTGKEVKLTQIVEVLTELDNIKSAIVQLAEWEKDEKGNLPRFTESVIDLILESVERIKEISLETNIK